MDFPLGQSGLDERDEPPDAFSSIGSSPFSSLPNFSADLISREENDVRELPPLHLPPPAQSVAYEPQQPLSPPNNVFAFFQEIARKKAKERRMHRMQILKIKRQNGLISFSHRVMHYQNKRRR